MGMDGKESRGLLDVFVNMLSSTILDRGGLDPRYSYFLRLL